MWWLDFLYGMGILTGALFVSMVCLLASDSKKINPLLGLISMLLAVAYFYEGICGLSISLGSLPKVLFKSVGHWDGLIVTFMFILSFSISFHIAFIGSVVVVALCVGVDWKKLLVSKRGSIEY
jgi:hypothetical protein